MNFIFFQPVITLPTSFAAMMQYANGLFILPILAAVSQFFMSQWMNGTQKKTGTAQQRSTNRTTSATESTNCRTSK